MKDFNDFLRILASDESKAEVERIILDNAMEEEREGNDIHPYLYTVIDAVTDYKLRKYHEWASQG